MKSYVYDGTEVRLTGREAIRKVGRAGAGSARELKLVEVTPVDPSFDWKKWVSPDQLYEVLQKDS